MTYSVIIRDIDSRESQVNEQGLNEEEVIFLIDKYGHFETVNENSEEIHGYDGRWYHISPWFEIRISEEGEEPEEEAYDPREEYYTPSTVYLR